MTRIAEDHGPNAPVGFHDPQDRYVHVDLFARLRAEAYGFTAVVLAPIDAHRATTDRVLKHCGLEVGDRLLEE